MRLLLGAYLYCEHVLRTRFNDSRLHWLGFDKCSITCIFPVLKVGGRVSRVAGARAKILRCTEPNVETFVISFLFLPLLPPFGTMHLLLLQTRALARIIWFNPSNDREKCAKSKWHFAQKSIYSHSSREHAHRIQLSDPLDSSYDLALAPRARQAPPSPARKQCYPRHSLHVSLTTRFSEIIK